MRSQETPLALIKTTLSNSLRNFKNKPIFFSPFIVFLSFEYLALLILYLAPRQPFRLLLGPPIRTLWSERFLHYPFNFLLLPKLISRSRMGLGIFIGSLITGIAVCIILDIYNNKRINLSKSFIHAGKKYFSLFTVVFILSAGFYLFPKILGVGLFKYFNSHQRLLFLGYKVWIEQIFIIINFIVAIFLLSAFIYAIPAIIIDNQRLFNSIVNSFKLFRKMFIQTIVLVGLPMLLTIPLLIAVLNMGFIIDKFFPEIVLFVLGLDILIGTLVIDPLITMSTTLLYIDKRKALL